MYYTTENSYALDLSEINQWLRPMVLSFLTIIYALLLIKLLYFLICENKEVNKHLQNFTAKSKSEMTLSIWGPSTVVLG